METSEFRKRLKYHEHRDRIFISDKILSNGDMVDLHEELVHSRDVKILSISVCYASPESRISLSSNVGKYNLTHLELSNFHMYDVSAIHLAESIRESKIKKVDVSVNEIGVDGGRAFARALANLEVLKISNNPIGLAVVDIANALRTPGSTLRSLDVSMTQCVDEGAFALALAIPVCNLSYLNVGGNGISNAGIKAICDATGSDTYSMMRELDIGGNTALSGETIDVVASMIGRSELEYLNLDGCGITKDGLSKLAYGVRENQYIEYLSLADNRNINTNDVVSFVNVIGKHRSFKDLYLLRTAVDFIGGHVIQGMLDSLHTKHATSFTMMMCARTRSKGIVLPGDLIRRLRDYLDT